MKKIPEELRHNHCLYSHSCVHHDHIQGAVCQRHERHICKWFDMLERPEKIKAMRYMENACADDDEADELIDVLYGRGRNADLALGNWKTGEFFWAYDDVGRSVYTYYFDLHSRQREGAAAFTKI